MEKGRGLVVAVIFLFEIGGTGVNDINTFRSVQTGHIFGGYFSPCHLPYR